MQTSSREIVLNSYRFTLCLPVFLFVAAFLCTNSIDCGTLLFLTDVERSPIAWSCQWVLRCQCVNAVCSACDHQAIAIGTSVLCEPEQCHGYRDTHSLEVLMWHIHILEQNRSGFAEFFKPFMEVKDLRFLFGSACGFCSVLNSSYLLIL